jgi:hypothetical protein
MGDDSDSELLALRADASDETVQRAALYIQDAYDGMHHVHPHRGRRARQAHLLWLRLQPAVQVVTSVLLLFSFFERPAWCAVEGMPVPNSTLYPMMGFPLLLKWPAVIVESVLIVVILADWLLQLRFQGARRYFAMRKQCAYAVVVVALPIDCLIAAATPWDYFRVATYLRMSLAVLTSKDILLQLELIRRAVPEILGVLFVFTGFLGFFAWSALLLFNGTSEGDLFSDGTNSSLPSASWQLLILLTTANYPDVMMPAYTRTRVSFLFFGAFLVLGNWFLLNLILAVVYKAHSDEVTAITAERSALQARSLHLAYWLLAGPRGVSADTMHRVFEELNYYTHIKFISPERARLLFAALDNGPAGYSMCSSNGSARLGQRSTCLGWRRRAPSVSPGAPSALIASIGSSTARSSPMRARCC